MINSCSKQTLWQRKQKQLGNCTQCGSKSIEGKSLCTACMIKRREYARVKYGHKPKQAGSPGRNIIHNL